MILPLIVFAVAVIVSRLHNQWPMHGLAEAPKGTFSGKVVGVSDGDTIRVLYKNGEVKVRLFGVDSPEQSQAYGGAAKKFTSNMVFGKTVKVEVVTYDRYSRAVGWIKTDEGRSLNQELVKAGLAWWYSHYDPYDTRLADLEAQARKAHRGLWAQRNPEPPWEFRKEERTRNAE
ncbi:MAG: thermonuclease family protein [Armatimonadetes bacterium]|nr:thermonuclease family protein [Armatimonadota bacterium]